MVLYCPKCGRKLPDDAWFCLYCGKSVRFERTGFPTAGGILAIIAASISIIMMLILSYAYVQSRSYGYYSSDYYNSYPLFAFLTFLVSVFGLYGGIHSLKRQKYASAIGGIAAMFLLSLISVLISLNDRYLGPVFAILFAAPSVVLAFLSCVFVAPRKKEFLSLPQVSVPTSNYIQCSICGHQNPAECNFCGRCGKPLRKDDTQIY